MRTRLGLALACLLAMTGIAAAQKHGGTLRVTHRDNPPSASILEEATISTDMPFMAVFNNLVGVRPGQSGEPAGPRGARSGHVLGIERRRPHLDVPVAGWRQMARRQAVQQCQTSSAPGTC